MDFCTYDCSLPTSPPLTEVLQTLMFVGIVSSGSVTNFFPSVVATLPGSNGGHISSIEALLLTAPPYVFGTLFCLINAWHADRTGERYLHVALPLCLDVIAFIVAVTRQDFAPRYIAIMLMIPGTYAAFVIGLGWISNVMPRPPAKRAAALAFINAVSNATSIYASYMYIGAPRYGK